MRPQAVNPAAPRRSRANAVLEKTWPWILRFTKTPVTAASVFETRRLKSNTLGAKSSPTAPSGFQCAKKIQIFAKRKALKKSIIFAIDLGSTFSKVENVDVQEIVGKPIENQ